MIEVRPTPRSGIRAPAFPVDVLRSLYAAHDLHDALKSLLHERVDLRETLRLASSSLGIGLDRWMAAQEADRHAAASALAYVARCCTRATPFAACATVGVIPVGHGPVPELSGPVRRRTRPDSGWLYGLAQAYEANPEFAAVLRLRTSGTGHVFHGRLEVYDVSRARVRAIGGRRAVIAAPTALNPTPAVRAAMARCVPGKTTGELTSTLANELGVPESSAAALIAKMLELGVFVSDVRVAPTGDPAARLLEVLERVDPSGARRLARVLDELRAADAVPVEAAGAALETARETAAALGAAAHYWQIDSTRDVAGVVPSALAERIAGVVRELLQITPVAQEHLALSKQFSAKYNAGREVPLLEVLDLARGLRMEDALERRRDAETDRREARLLELAVNAIADDEEYVDLTRERLDALRVGESAIRYPTHLEVICSIRRGAADELEPAHITGAFEGYERSLARFHDLLDARDGPLPTGEAVIADYVALPHARRSANVGRQSHRERYEVVAGVWSAQSPERTITLDDLLVGVAGGRVYLRSRRLGRVVVVRQSHLLNPDTTSRVAQFFKHVCSSDLPMVYFDWGEPVRRLPYSPGARIDGVAVAVPTWRVPRDLALKWDGDEARAWRRRWRLPERVYLAVRDNRLMLDLRHDLCVEQIRRTARKGPAGATVDLQAAVPDIASAPLNGPGGRYFAEVALTFTVKARADERSEVSFASSVARADVLFGPGSEWLYFKAYIGRERASYFIEKRVPELLERVGDTADSMHFLRYADPEHHVRIRLHARDGQARPGMYERALAVTDEWVRNGLLERIAFDTYDREVERYGGLACMGMAEAIFEVSSRTVLGALPFVRVEPESSSLVLAAVVAFALALGGSTTDALAILKAVIGRRPRLDGRDWQRIREARASIEGPDQGAVRLAALAATLRERTDDASFNEIFRSLLHMHCNRFGIEPQRELAVLYAATAVLESLQASAKAMVSA